MSDRPPFRLGRTKSLFVFSRPFPPRAILSRNGQPAIGKEKVWSLEGGMVNFGRTGRTLFSFTSSSPSASLEVKEENVV